MDSEKLILKEFNAKEKEDKTVWQAKLEFKNRRIGEKTIITVEAPTKKALMQKIDGSVGSIYECSLVLYHEGNGSTLNDFDLEGIE